MISTYAAAVRTLAFTPIKADPGLSVHLAQGEYR